MPIYEYKCADCGAQVERMQKVSDEPLTVCETCGGKLEKQWSLSGFQFKGAGWYVTDYSAKGKEAAAAGKSATSEAGDKSEKFEKGEGSEKTEKTSAESTAKTDGASNKTTDTAASSKKETVSKND